MFSRLASRLQSARPAQIHNDCRNLLPSQFAKVDPGKKKINSAISLAQDGLYGKACQTLISSGVALNNVDT